MPIDKQKNIEYIQLQSFVAAFCKRYNVQLFCVLAKPSAIIDVNGNQNVDLISTSHIHDDLFPAILNLVSFHIEEIKKEKSKKMN